MLEKISSVDLIEIIENGAVQIRTKTAVLEDGKEISATYHRHVILPGDNYSNESDRVKNVCALIHTSDVVQQFEANKKPII